MLLHEKWNMLEMAHRNVEGLGCNSLYYTYERKVARIQQWNINPTLRVMDVWSRPLPVTVLDSPSRFQTDCPLHRPAMRRRAMIRTRFLDDFGGLAADAEEVAGRSVVNRDTILPTGLSRKQTVLVGANPTQPLRFPWRRGFLGIK